MTVHRLPSQDEPFDPRRAALSHAGMAEQLGQLVGHDGPSDPMRLVGEVASALACGLVYVGDQVREARGGGEVSLSGRRTQAVADVLHLFDPEGKNERLQSWAAAILRGELPEPPQSPLVGVQVVGWDPENGGGVLVRVPQGATYRIQVGMPFEIPARLTGVADEGDRWREFLIEQAAQIPDGVESACRELVAMLGRRVADGALEPFPEDAVGPLQSLSDWLNQLSNVRREVDDGGASE